MIYSLHYYDNRWSKRITNWERDYASFKLSFDWNINAVTIEGEEYTAPIWIGEWGTSMDNGNYGYWRYLIRYLQENPHINWAYWSYNGYQMAYPDDYTSGFMHNDFKTIRHCWKFNDILTIMELTDEERQAIADKYDLEDQC